MKRTVTMLLSVLMLLSLLTACGGKPSTNNDGGADDKVITIGIPENAAVTDYDTNAYTLWLEEQLGYDLQFQFFATSSADYKAQLSTMMLNENDDLPDILMNFSGLGDATWEVYGEDGYFISLSPYFEDKEGKAKIWWERTASFDQEYVNNVLRRCTADDGQIYAFPRIESTMIDTMDYMVCINKTWLENLNLEMPTDPDSLYTVLKAFKEQDANGNGDPTDEIPLAGTQNQCGDVINWLINMFIYFDDATYFNLSEDAKTLTTPFTEDKYREALAYCKKLVDEGLLHPSVFTMGVKELKGQVNPATGTYRIGMFCGHPTSHFETEADSIYEYSPVPIWGNAVIKENLNSREAFITEDALENGKADACWELLMLMCSEEGSYRQRYGQKDVDWVEADPGTTSFMDLPATIKLLNDAAFSSINNQTWHAITACVLPNAENEVVQYDETNTEWMQYKLGLNAQQHTYFYEAVEKNNPQYIMPMLVYGTEESEATINERNNCKSVVESYRMKFILGTEGLDVSNDAHWQMYLDELKKEGLQVWYDQAQEIYTNNGYYEEVIANQG